MAKKKNYQVYQHFFVYHTPYIALIMTFTGACALAVALMSFSEWDMSPFYVSTESDVVTNWYGVIGAFVSSSLFYYVGYSAWCLSLFLFFNFFILIKKETFRSRIDQLCGWVLLFITSMPFFYYIHWSPAFYFMPGGMIGRNLYQGLSYLIGVHTTKIGICIFLVSSLILIMRISFSQLLQGVRYSIFFVRHLYNCFIVPGIQLFTRLTIRLYHKGMRFLRFIYTTLAGTTVKTTELNLYEFEQGVHVGEGSMDDVAPVLLTDSLLEEKQNENGEQPISSDTLTTAETSSIKKRIAELFKLPTDTLLHPVMKQSSSDAHENTSQLSHVLEEKLARFGIQGKVQGVKQGPVVTLFEYQPDPNAKVSRILALEDDLAMALEALSVRIIAPIPGTSRVGIEVANKERTGVYMNEIIRSPVFKKNAGKLPFVLGKDTVGNNVVADLADMPHLLVAGSTGSGKSVCLNTLLISLLCKLSPDELKLVIIDPKRLEFTAYHDIPHLLFPVITHPSKAAPVLAWLTRVMEERYEKMAQKNVRNIGEYKKLCKSKNIEDDMPYIVVMIDELADLMIIARKEIEESIARLAQMARAAGIHLILATQRPSVDVLTGVIKVNFPSRIAFRVSSKIDSRTIIDTSGAEKLLGKGDMLFMDAHSAGMRRIHGAYITDTEIASIVDFIKKQRAPEYIDLQSIIAQHNTAQLQENDDPLLQDIIKSLEFIDELSISSLQRKFSIGYNRSARLVEHLEAMGYILPADGGKMRKIIK